ncbi:unnamed protein product [Closterium sp. NIES-65]|nr:unnamed protein product [Closterium sp. NIES-65]
MKALRAGSKEAASCPAIISVAGATVDLPPEQWKLHTEDKHPLTARLFDFVTGYLEKEVHEHVRIVTSGVVADIVAGRDEAVQAFAGAAGVSNRGGARGGTVVHADDEGAEDTATKGATRDEADRAVAREGEESSEEEAEAHVVAAVASSKPTTSGKSIKHLAQHLAPGAGSAGPSGEVAGKSPVTGPRDHASLSSLPSHKLAAEILQLECRLAAQAEVNARLKKRQESGVGGVAVVGFEELALALASAVRMLEKEARAIAQERAALVDTRNQEALVLGRVDARLG